VHGSSFVESEKIQQYRWLVAYRLDYDNQLHFYQPRHHSSTIISPHQCHHHYSYHPSPHHSFFPTSKLFSFSNPTLHRHLAPLSDWFHGCLELLTFFSHFSFFVSVILISFFYSFFWSHASISLITVCFLFFMFYITVVPFQFLSFHLHL